MKRLFIVACWALLISVRANAQTNDVLAAGTPGETQETIVCLRHGEKPPGGLGQLSCHGLNRALALPKVLLAKFGVPQFVFAANPAQKVDRPGAPHFVVPPNLVGKLDPDGYNYVRPLMTIEPTAISCGLPVNTQFGFLEISGLEQELQKPKYQTATVFVAWEHYLLDEFVKNLVKDNGGDPATVPAWPDDDYDTIFVVKITQAQGQKTFSFTIDHEGLNSLSDNCP